MKKDYETELHLLRQAAQKFAQQYPEQTRMLNLQLRPGQDPHIERLLEGMAFIFAQLKNKIDNDLPEICETLLLATWPKMIYPFPSATIMEFTPKLGQLHQTYQLQAGNKIFGHSTKNNSPYYFTTNRKLKINPMAISTIELKNSDLLTITIQVAPKISLEQLDLHELIFYIATEHAAAINILHLLTTKVATITITLPNQKLSIKLGKQEQLVQLLPQNNDNRSLLLDYFLFPNTLLFFSINGLEKILQLDNQQQFTLNIHLKEQLNTTTPIDKNILRLHCVPAINLYRSSGKPIHINHRKHEYAVAPDQNNPEEIIYSINKISETNSFDLNANCNNYHLLKNKHDYRLIADNIDHTDKVISTELDVCNGQLPQQELTSNSIININHDIPHYLCCTNLTRPTSMYLPPYQEKYPWALIKMLQLNINSLANLTTLHEQLELYNWDQCRNNINKIKAITNITMQTYNKIAQGCAHQCIALTLTLQEEAFQSIADVHLFGSILHNLLLTYSNINYLLKTKIIYLPSKRELIWQEQPGANFPI